MLEVSYSLESIFFAIPKPFSFLPSTTASSCSIQRAIPKDHTGAQGTPRRQVLPQPQRAGGHFPPSKNLAAHARALVLLCLQRTSCLTAEKEVTGRSQCVVMSPRGLVLAYATRAKMGEVPCNVEASSHSYSCSWQICGDTSVVTLSLSVLEVG